MQLSSSLNYQHQGLSCLQKSSNSFGGKHLILSRSVADTHELWKLLQEINPALRAPTPAAPHWGAYAKYFLRSIPKKYGRMLSCYFHRKLYW